MEFFYGHAVSLCLGFGDDAENPFCGFKGAGSDCPCICCAVQNLVNFGQVPMFVMMVLVLMVMMMLYIPFFVRMHVVCVVTVDMHCKRKPRDAIAARALHMDVDAF